MDDPASEGDAERLSVLAADLRVLIGKLKRKLREQTQLGDLSWSQISVLSHLDRHGPSTVTALARAEGMRPQSMGATVATLEAAGLVQGAPDPADGRQTILSLTEFSRTKIAAGRAAREDWLVRAIERNLAPGERDELAKAIRLLARIVEA